MQEKTSKILGIALTVGLIVWGAYTTISYAGVPVHQSVLIGNTSAGEGCPEPGYFCRGIESIVPAITHSVARWFWTGSDMTPFGWFVALSLMTYAGLFGWNILRNGDGTLRLQLSPLKMGVIFVAMLWLLFTCISMGGGGDMPYRRIFEPSPQIYANAGTEALDTLKGSFDSLKERGCLTYLGMTDRNVGVYDMKAICMQQYFFTRVLTQLLFLGVLSLVMLGFGGTLLKFLKFRAPNLPTEATLAAGAGCCALIVLLWLIAFIGVFTMPVIWTLLLLIAGLSWREIWRWISAFRTHTWSVTWTWKDTAPLLGWLLLFYLAFNFVTVVRPFPIGWDDLGVYLNKPRLLVSYGKLIPQMSTFQWEYLTSLGFVLFGYDSFFGATAAMMINWGAGALAVLSIFAFARSYLPKSAVLASLLYYTLPLVGHFSFADMKVDNAVFATGSIAMLCGFLALLPPGHEDHPHHERRADHSWLLLAGLFVGFSFGMKATSMMVFMTIGTIIAGVLTGWIGFYGAAMIVCGIFSLMILNVPDMLRHMGLPGDAISKTTLGMIFVVIGGTLLAASLLRRRQALLPFAKAVGIYVAAFAVSIAPWLVYNNIQSNSNFPRMILTPPNHLSAVIDIEAKEQPVSDYDVRILPPELAVDYNSEACKPTAKTEELDRYWGFSSGWKHYLTLPWRTTMNADSAGYYVTTMAALLLFPLLLLLPWFWKRSGEWMRWLFAGTLLLVVQWMFLANGIPWYGIGMFLGLSIGLAAMVERAPDRWSRWLAGLLIGISVLFNLANRYWQFENMRNLYEYAIGKVSAEAMQERTIPHYDDVRDFVLERADTMPDRPFVYRVGTFIPYFIPKNLELIPLADNQLELFKCIYQEKDAKLTLARFKALGFNSIIFDTNTHTIERDPNGTLHQKVRSFLEFLNTPGLGLKVIVNDPDGGIAFLLLP